MIGPFDEGLVVIGALCRTNETPVRVCSIKERLEIVCSHSLTHSLTVTVTRQKVRACFVHLTLHYNQYISIVIADLSTFIQS
jgi:hypothetical protein